MLENGETLLTEMIKRREQHLIPKLMEAKNGLEFLTMTNKGGLLPIFVALKMRTFETVQDIILESLTMDLKDPEGVSPTEHLFRMLNENLINSDAPINVFCCPGTLVMIQLIIRTRKPANWLLQSR